jgi:hypothetical protein
MDYKSFALDAVRVFDNSFNLSVDYSRGPMPLELRKTGENSDHSLTANDIRALQNCLLMIDALPLTPVLALPDGYPNLEFSVCDPPIIMQLPTLRVFERVGHAVLFDRANPDPFRAVAALYIRW